MNVRGGNWFVEAPYQAARQRWAEWVQGTLAGRLVCLELGVGFNTPSVIRWPLEQITHQHPRATLLRVNRDHPQVPRELAGKALAVAAPLYQVLADWTAQAALASSLPTTSTPAP